MITMWDVRGEGLHLHRGVVSGAGDVVGNVVGVVHRPRAGACRTREGERRRLLIRQGGSALRPRRTGAAGHSAALATGWPFQRPAAAGL